MRKIESFIRTIPDFPRTGIQFKDISPLLADADAFRDTIDAFKDRHAVNKIDMVVGIEARGFVFASTLAYALRAGTCMARKPGKLPHDVHQENYELEYGSDAIEIQADALKDGQRILVFDDVLATGGTAGAAARLIERHFDVEIVELVFLLEIKALKGREKLHDWPLFSLIKC